MSILNGIIEKYRKLFESSGDPAARRTFPGELNYDSGKYFIGVFIALLIWLPYISLDANLHRFPAVTMYLRVSLTAVSVVLIALKLTKPLQDRPYISMMILMGYLFIATPVITATAGEAHITAYIGGYSYVIMLALIFPISFRYKIGIMCCSLVIFFAFSFVFGLNFSYTAVRYTLNDMLGAVSISVIFSYVNYRLRYNSWEQKQIIDEQHKTIMASINYASKIQRNLLPPESAMEEAFADYSVIWEPRDVVGGDIYWMKRFDIGTVLCVCDCTGHSTPGAFLTMLVVSALESIVKDSNCDDTAGIVLNLDRKLSHVLHVDPDGSRRRSILSINDGCNIAVLFIADDGSVRFSSDTIPVFICDGSDVTQYKGQKISVGEGKLISKGEVDVHCIPASPRNKYYIASDGLFDQMGSVSQSEPLRAGDSSVRSRQYGYKKFEQIILENHDEKQSAITGKVWDSFVEYRGKQAQRDDFELVAFVPRLGNRE